MSEQNERYVDPNSGAAPQPGGRVSPGVSEETQQQMQAAYERTEGGDATYDASQEHEAAPAGPQPGAEDAAPGGEVNEGVPGTAGNPEATEETEETEGDEYDQLVSDKTVDELEEHIQAHPEDRDGIVAAEQKREHPRKGVLEL